MSWVQEVREKTSSAPRTSLGFYAGLCAIVFAGTSGLAATLAKWNAPEWLIVTVVLFGLVVFAAVVAAVIYLNVRAPEKLMLAQISGKEYSAITRGRTQLGDSKSTSPPTASAEVLDLVEDAVVIEGELEAAEDDSEEAVQP